MGIVSWIILGGLAGWLASIIMRRNDRMGCLANIGVGILGAFLGGLAMNRLGHQGVTGFNFHSFLVALGGAVVLLAILSLIWGRKKERG
jgi:uncharacterized membrane protein YeaQ/YmgE (transglycosylase-associated protein family)